MKINSLKRYLSLVLAIIIIANSTVLCVNASEPLIQTEMFTYWNDGETKVVGYEEIDGDKIFLQYINDELVQKNTIYSTNPDMIYREYFEPSSANAASNNRAIPSYTNELSVYDVITVNNIRSNSNIAVNATSQTAGTINYRTPNDNGTYYY